MLVLIKYSFGNIVAAIRHYQLLNIISCKLAWLTTSGPTIYILAKQRHNNLLLKHVPLQFLNRVLHHVRRVLVQRQMQKGLAKVPAKTDQERRANWACRCVQVRTLDHLLDNVRPRLAHGHFQKDFLLLRHHEGAILRNHCDYLFGRLRR